jgi:hypothetical protein
MRLAACAVMNVKGMTEQLGKCSVKQSQLRDLDEEVALRGEQKVAGRETSGTAVSKS